MHSRQTTKLARRKKSYRSPDLTKYGRLKDITTGGSGKHNENKKAEPGKKP